jgi:hypothetical protein
MLILYRLADDVSKDAAQKVRVGNFGVQLYLTTKTGALG